MKKLLILLIAVFLLPLSARINVTVTIPPIKTFVQKIAGGNTKVNVMVPPGSSPHTYEPKASQMRKLSTTDLYLAIGTEFESVWLPRFRSQHPDMKVVHVDRGIKRLPMQTTNRQKRAADTPQKLDPHIWLSPANVRLIATNIADDLCDVDKEHCGTYRSRLTAFLETIDHTDQKIREALNIAPAKKVFMTYHPSWGYFAHEYGLKQFVIETEGKPPKASELIDLINVAKYHYIFVIVTQPEIAEHSARIIARQMGLRIVSLSPLSHHWSHTLIRLAETITSAK